MRFLRNKDGDAIHLAPTGAMPEAVHVLDEPSIQAVNAALAARRPLLVRGEPGIGKSQLARAAAKELGRAYVHQVVDSRTESRDLLWHFDAVERLAEAQMRGALGEDKEQLKRDLAVKNYLHPGPLWWAFDWGTASKRAKEVGRPVPTQRDGGNPDNGCLVLIDEIDKAESDVPNGLLEALGNGSFTPHGMDQPVKVGQIPPLVIITTNEERALPDAFVRRCLVLHLELPDLPDQRDAMKALLMKRGRAHFQAAVDDVLSRAADLLIQHREDCLHQHRLPLPGQAELLDLLRAVITLREDPDGQEALLEEVSRFAVHKHPPKGH